MKFKDIVDLIWAVMFTIMVITGAIYVHNEDYETQKIELEGNR